MPGSTEVIGFDSLALEKWAITKDKSLVFEDLIGKYLRNQIGGNDGVEIRETPVIKDYGKDFVIRFSGELRIFSTTLRSSESDKPSTVFVEVKSTEHQRLAEDFLVDYTQAIDQVPDFYMLVTNSTITPYYQYLAQKNWRARNCEFILVDKYLLNDSIHRANFEDAFKEKNIAVPDYNNKSEQNTSIEYQVERRSFSSNKEIDLYLSLRNFSDEARFFSLKLSADLSWAIDASEIDCFVGAGEIETYKLKCDRLLFDGPADLRITVRSEDNENQIVINEKGLEFVFDPPFVGTEHHYIRNSFVEHLKNLRNHGLLSITGEAGIGKSRILDEVVQVLNGSDITFYKCYFKPESDQNDFLKLLKDLGLDPKEHEQPEELLRELLVNYDPKYEKPVIIFEDLHHASPKMIRVFKEFVAYNKSNGNTLFIVTGRNDFTFPNEEYFSLVQLIASSSGGHGLNFEVEPLSKHEAENLVRQLIYNAPTLAVEKVLKVSQNNPFYILEFVQYFLDMNLAQLLSKKHIGILEVERFSGIEDLPESVNELLEARLASLLSSQYGKDCFDFLMVMSYFGFGFEREVSSSYLDGVDNDNIWWTLISRRFVKEDYNGHRSFAHENILNFVKSKARSEQYREKSARLVLNFKHLYSLLGEFEKAEIQYQIGEYQTAFSHYKPIWTRVKGITNFSSEEINKSYFHHLDSLFDIGIKLNVDTPILINTALAKAYMGIHNFPIYLGLKACIDAEKMLRKVADKKNRDYLLNSVKQMRAHGLLNMGRTLESLKLMLEIESEIKNKKISNPQLEFDLNDRLQEYYRKTNHNKLVTDYGQRASIAVNYSKDPKLKACHLITKAGTMLYSGQKAANTAASEALEVSKKIGVFRFEVYNKLTLLIIKALYGDQKDLIQVHKEGRELLITAAKNNLSDSIMRVQLLLATCVLQVNSDSEEALVLSRSYIKSGQENSIRYGNGLFDWAFDNLAGIIELKAKVKPDIPRAYFQTCHERLKRRGLLFLGAWDGLYPNNLALSNIIRYFGSISEQRGLELIRSTNSYENSYLFSESKQREILKSALDRRAIFSTKRKTVSLTYPLENGYFTPLF